MKKTVKHVRRLAVEGVFHWLFRLFYITGLTLLIPVIFMLHVPLEAGKWVYANIGVFLAAILFIFLAFRGLYWRKKNKRKVLQSLARMTFIPGALALLFSLLGEQMILGFAERTIIGFETIEPYVQTYVVQTLPKVWTLTFLYLILGIGLYIMSKKFK